MNKTFIGYLLKSESLPEVAKQWEMQIGTYNVLRAPFHISLLPPVVGVDPTQYATEAKSLLKCDPVLVSTTQVSAFREQKVIKVSLEKTESLQKLHERLLPLFLKYSPAEKPPTDLSEVQREVLKRYGSPFVASCYNPHISLVYAKCTQEHFDLVSKKLPQDHVEKIVVDRLHIFHKSEGIWHVLDELVFN